MPAVQMWALWGIINVCTTNSKHLLISNCLNSPLANKQLRQDDAFDFCKVEHRWKPLFDPIDRADINFNPPPPSAFLSVQVRQGTLKFVQLVL